MKLSSENRDRPNSQEPIPTFDEWCASCPIALSPNSPRTLRDLYEDVNIRREAALTDEEGVVTRFGKIACINVFFEEGGRRFVLYEERHRLNAGRTFEEFLAGDLSAISPSHSRPMEMSLSERLSLEGESPMQGAVRALVEELFEHALSLLPQGAFTDLGNTLEKALYPLNADPVLRRRDPDDPGNSYQGLPSLLEEYRFEIIFDSSSQVPIRTINGVPQPLYEYLPEKGYVNAYRWKEVE